MTPPTDKPQAREWWLEESPMNDDEWYGYGEQQTDNDIHVIEKSAYDAMKAERDVLKHGWDERANAWKLECERLAGALVDVKQFWASIETPKPYYIGDKCDDALTAHEQFKKELK